MAGVAANFIGFAATGAFGVVPLIQELFPPPADQTTTIRIQLGQNATQGASLGGNLPGVSLWDEQGEAIGSSTGGGQLPQGNFKDVKIVAHPNVGNVPAAYVSISASGDDAVCIAFVTITQANGDSSTFTGDVPAQCGATWFESSITLGTDGSHPQCVWIDKNGSDGLQDQGFGFHVRDFFGTKAQGTAFVGNSDLMCKSGPRFRMYPQLKAKESILFYNPPLDYNQDGTDKDPSKVINNPGSLTQIDDDEQRQLCMDPDTRPLQPCDKCATFPLPGVACDDKITKRDHMRMQGKRTYKNPMPQPSNPTWAPTTTGTPNANANTNGTSSWRFESALIISGIPVHSASKLCASANSYGPDFVATSEGKFCDMKRKYLWDVCSDQKSTCCFDVEQTQLRLCAGGRRRGIMWRQVASAGDATEYTNVQYW